MSLSAGQIQKIGKEISNKVEGKTLFDEFSRGRYSTDASVYQIKPIGVVLPRDTNDVLNVMEYSQQNSIPLLARGGGSSQCGQTVGESIILDYSRHQNRILDIDVEERSIWVEPGVVLDHLNAYLKPHGLWFPVDVSTSSRATIGGMSANNSCGSRSLYYGNMVHNVLAIETILDDGSIHTFDEIQKNYLVKKNNQDRLYKIIDKFIDLKQRVGSEIDENWPTTQRRVGGYNIDLIDPNGFNSSHLLVGSEGTLSLFNKIKLKLSELPKNRILGVCYFDNFHQAMELTKEIVKLKPTCVELMDQNLLNLAKEIPIYADGIKKYIKGNPKAVLMVEFIDTEQSVYEKKIKDLEYLVLNQNKNNQFSHYSNLEEQKEVFEIRKAGLNILMSMKGNKKPVAFIEDCAVSLDHLADYTAQLKEIFKKYNTSGMFYAHASVGTLHIRPVLNMKSDEDIKNMRSISEESFEIVKNYKGSHSGEHGDGIVRSEFHEMMFGKKIVNAFEEIKDTFDRKNLLNPGKIVRPLKSNDRSLMRYKSGYQAQNISTHYDWSNWGQFTDAVEMCNNNGACRKLDSGVMCPSYRVTKEEKDLVRGRANTLRLALSNQLPEGSFASKEMYETMELCVSCKACQRECPMSVDMAKMKSEFLSHYYKKFSMRIKDRITSEMPRLIWLLKIIAPIFNKVKNLPLVSSIVEKFGFAVERNMPEVQNQNSLREIYNDQTFSEKKVILFADTFNVNFENQNLIYSIKVLNKFGYQAIIPSFGKDKLDRPLCCGRTYISYGQLDKASNELNRFNDYIINNNYFNLPVVGIEPSCLLTFNDEYQKLKNVNNREKIKNKFYLLEEFILEQIRNDNKVKINKFDQNVLIHGHCHQKSQDRMKGLTSLLSELEINNKMIDSSCCGMAGSFGYDSKHYEVSKKMANLSLIPAINNSDETDFIIANGTSCRHQISDLSNKKGKHVSELLFKIFETVN
ncbi:FAD-binding and (Fe-S)-binding domain-containing protein [Candidatus Pelagibacter sp.]|nr:FAD-binding and (Fe-S)-binding domain-containing protein [Candidatus Pelagibacter sp.]